MGFEQPIYQPEKKQETKNLSPDLVKKYFDKIKQFEEISSHKEVLRGEIDYEPKKTLEELDKKQNQIRRDLENLRKENPDLYLAEEYLHKGRAYNELTQEIFEIHNKMGQIELKRKEKGDEKLNEEIYQELLSKRDKLYQEQEKIRTRLDEIRNKLGDKQILKTVEEEIKGK